MFLLSSYPQDYGEADWAGCWFVCLLVFVFCSWDAMKCQTCNLSYFLLAALLSFVFFFFRLILPSPNLCSEVRLAMANTVMGRVNSHSLSSCHDLWRSRGDAQSRAADMHFNTRRSTFPSVLTVHSS